MDPLSIIAGVFGVTGAALQNAQALKDMVDSIKDNLEEITAMSKDTDASANVVSSLDRALRDRNVMNAMEGDSNVTDAVGKPREPLQNCSKILG